MPRITFSMSKEVFPITFLLEGRVLYDQQAKLFQASSPSPETSTFQHISSSTIHPWTPSEKLKLTHRISWKHNLHLVQVTTQPALNWSWLLTRVAHAGSSQSGEKLLPFKSRLEKYGAEKPWKKHPTIFGWEHMKCTTSCVPKSSNSLSSYPSLRKCSISFIAPWDSHHTSPIALHRNLVPSDLQFSVNRLAQTLNTSEDTSLTRASHRSLALSGHHFAPAQSRPRELPCLHAWVPTICS